MVGDESSSVSFEERSDEKALRGHNTSSENLKKGDSFRF